MGKESYLKTCDCGNKIEIDTYHHANGVNDKDNTKLKCDNCGKEFNDMIKNIESAKISGAKVVN